MKRLLTTLEPLSHAARAGRMAELGRKAATGETGKAGDASEAASLLAALRAGNGFERRLALQACWGTRDGAAAARALADPSRLTRGKARSMATALATERQLAEAAILASRIDRARLVARLRRRNRLAAIDAILQALPDQTGPEAMRLLPQASPQRVAAALADVAGIDWNAMARRHPTLTAAHLLQAARQAPEADQRLLRHIRWTLPELAEHAPDAALDLVHLLVLRVPLSDLRLDNLIRRRPQAMAALCLAGTESLPGSFEDVAHLLEPAQLLALLERFGRLGRPWQTGGSPIRWLRRLPAGQRKAIYDLLNRGWRDSTGAISPAILALLPPDDRQAEARRHLALPALATRHPQRLPYAGLLPWAEARRHLDADIGDPEPERRGAALQALSGCVRFERDHTSTLLGLLLSRRNEQDPVRGALLRGLADLPPSVWQPVHLDSLGQAFRHALDAADLSPATASQIACIIVGLLPREPAWAGDWLATLARARGALALPFLQDRLSPADIGRLAGHLMPVLEEWYQRERDGEILAVARQLGARLRQWTGLATLVERILQRTRSSGVAATALDLLRRHRSDRLHLLVPALLEADPSFIQIGLVQQHLHRHRQDLLSRFLGKQGHKGRFSTGETYLVLLFGGGFHRWTPAQQRLSEASGLGLVDSPKADSPGALSVIRQLAALPDTEPASLVRLAAADSPRPAIRDAALRGLGRRDAGDGLPALLGALEDDRSRIAIYAMRRTLLDLPVVAALDLLRKVTLRRVTVAKEVFRLVGDLPDEAAYAWLLERAADDQAGKLHRDVRIALLRAFWSHLEREGSWDVLRRAAGSNDPAVAAAVAQIPPDRLSPAAMGRLTGLLALLLGHRHPRVRAEALRRCGTGSLGDPGRQLAAPLLALLGSALPDERQQAARAILAAYPHDQAAMVAQAAAAIRDDRRALATLTATLRAWAEPARERGAATVQAVLEVLADDPLLAAHGTELAAAALPAGLLAAHLHATADRLHAEALARAIEIIGAASGRTVESLETLETALRDAADPALRRLALAALQAQAATGAGWSDPRLDRLRAYRQDSAPLVAEAAQFTFPPDEPGTAPPPDWDEPELSGPDWTEPDNAPDPEPPAPGVAPPPGRVTGLFGRLIRKFPI